MKLTIFDLDNTLLAGDSDYAWGQFLVDKGVVDAEKYTRENERFYQQYQQKTLDIHEYQRFVLTPLIALTEQQKTQLHREFMATVIQDLRLPKAEALIRQHQQAGDQLLIITATNRFIAGPIGPCWGIEQVLATEPEERDGVFTGAITGAPCFQEGKITRLQAWLTANQYAPESMTFYSDSINDLPLLEYVDRPVAVDPDPVLKAQAEQKQWPIISLR